MRPLVSSVLLVLGVLACAGAQSTPPVTWSLSVGLNGSWRPGTWAPVILDVGNTGPSVRGQLAVPLSPGPSAGPSAPPGVSPAAYVLDLDLPAQSRKRFQLCLPADGLKDITVALGPQAVGREITVRDMAGPETLLLIVAGGEEGFLRFLSGATLGASAPTATRSARRIECNQVAWEKAPGSWLGWDAAHAVVVGDASLSQAAPATLTALLQWVQTGGTIILPGGATGAALAGTTLAPMLPLTEVHTRAAGSLPGLARWLGGAVPAGPVMMLDGSPRAGAEVLVGAPGQPVILRCRHGSGTVIMPLFDFTVKPFKYWDRQQAFWSRLLMEPAPAHPLTDKLGTRGESLAELAATMREARLPSFFVIGTFLVIYLLVLGPVQYMVLKSLDKREYAWLVTPAIIVSFCFGAYFISVGTRGRQTVTQTISLIETEPGVTAGRATSWSSIFSPTMSRYDVRFGETVGGVRVYGSAGGNDGGCTVRRRDGQILLHRLPISMWSSRTFGLTSLVDLKQGLEVQRCEWDGAKLQVKLRNRTGLRFVATYLIGAGRQSPAGALAPGAVLDKDMVENGAYSLMTGPGAPPGGPPSSRSRPTPPAASKDPAETLRLEVLEMLMRSGPHPFLSSADHWGPYFIAIAETPAVGISYDRAVRRTDLTVVAMPLPVQLPPRRLITVPGWLMQAVTSGEPSGGSSSREVLMRHRLPTAPSGSRVVTLKVWPQPTGSITAVRLYNQSAGKWVDISTTKMTQPRQPHQYFSRSGEILVQAAIQYPGPWVPGLTCVVQTN